MKRTLLICLFLLSFSTAANERVKAHNHAISELEKLTFIKDGRGMTITPDAINMFNFMAKLLGQSQTENSLISKESSTSFLGKKWGFVEHEGKIKGLHNVKYKEMNVGTVGCIVCHSGKAAGQYIIGLGNKNIDVGQLGTDVYRGSKLWAAMNIFKRKSSEYKRIAKDSTAFAKRLADNRYNNLTQGLVPVSMIRWWFYNTVEGKGLPLHEPRGAGKVPHFWGYGEKRFIGQFSDGFGNGTHAGWGLAVELAATQTAQNVRAQMAKIEHAENLLHDILPPAYPFGVNQKSAARGKSLFDRSCKKCHGAYQRDEAGIAIFQEPEHISIERIKTDDDRLKGNTDHFKSLVDRNPLSDYIQYNDFEPGYFAPRLEGIWARFPYLHNASVPTIFDLISHPDQRPQFWDLTNAGERHRFDEKKMGLTLPQKETRKYRSLLRKAKKGNRRVYWTARQGQSNQGHWFKSWEKFSDQDKYDIVEYLKTL